MMPDALSPLGNPCGGVFELRGLDCGDVRVSELTDRGAVLCSVAGAPGPEAPRLSQLLACPLPEHSGQSGRVGEREAIWLSPRSWLVLCARDDEMGITAAVAAAWPDRFVHAAPYGDALCWLSLSGADAEAALRQGGFLTLDAGGFPVHNAKRTLLASIPALLIRDGVDTWRIGIERSRARYFTGWLAGLTLYRRTS